MAFLPAEGQRDVGNSDGWGPFPPCIQTRHCNCLASPVEFETVTSKISVIIPALNEAQRIATTLSALQPFRAGGHEVIVIDGGSEDGTVACSQFLADRVVVSRRGRSRQMNAGACVATGETLLFLHADTSLPKWADRWIVQGLASKGRKWGRFDVKLSGTHLLLRVVEGLMNLRSRLTGIATGDQAIFVQKDLFETVGGFRDIDLMEDIALSMALKRYGKPLCLWQRVTTSSRRWENNGILRTLLLMWGLRLAYLLGAHPSQLTQRYEALRDR